MVQSATENYAGIWGNRIGFGTMPVILCVDFVRAYTTPGSPLYASGVVSAVACTPRLLKAAREAAIRIIHTNILYRAPDCADGGMWVRKSPVMNAMVPSNPLTDFCEAVAPIHDELVITKQYASAFFGTGLASILQALKVDTVVIVGCSTSGCIRATAVDAVQHGFRTIVVRDCVGDRHVGPHEANLFDIDAKYGDVVSIEEAISYVGHPDLRRSHGHEDRR